MLGLAILRVSLLSLDHTYFMNRAPISAFLLLIIVTSFVALIIERNVCHFSVSVPPENAPANYINSGFLCGVNLVASVPASYLVIGWNLLRGN